jgi:hypothetical protein
MWAPIYRTTWHHILLKHWCLSTKLCCITFIWNFGNHLPNHMTSHPRKVELHVYNCHNFRSHLSCSVFMFLLVIVMTQQHLLFLACTHKHMCIYFSAVMYGHTVYLFHYSFILIWSTVYTISTFQQFSMHNIVWSRRIKNFMSWWIC